MIERDFKMNYFQQLKSPEWKKKRIAILERDGNCCAICGDIKRLEVHHFYYIAKRMAWNYPDDSLLTLCKDCHENATIKQANEVAMWEEPACAIIKTLSTIQKTMLRP